MANAKPAVSIAVDNDASPTNFSPEERRQGLRMVEALLFASAEPVSAEDLAARLPLGTRLRILPNHACATGAQHPVYQALDADGSVMAWPRFHGW